MGHDLDECLLEQWSWIGGDVFAQSHLDLLIFWVALKIRPFLGVSTMIVEFLAAVDVPDVTPAFRADGKFGIIIACDGGVIPFGIGLAQEGNEAVSVELIPGRQIA